MNSLNLIDYVSTYEEIVSSLNAIGEWSGSINGELKSVSITDVIEAIGTDLDEFTRRLYLAHPTHRHERYKDWEQQINKAIEDIAIELIEGV